MYIERPSVQIVVCVGVSDHVGSNDYSLYHGYQIEFCANLLGRCKSKDTSR